MKYKIAVALSVAALLSSNALPSVYAQPIFTALHGFMPLSYVPDIAYGTNSDGAYPGSLILSSNILYGTAFWGGNSGNGTVFAVNTDGTDFTNLYIFTAFASQVTLSNSDGSNPNSLILSGNTLYGTANEGGSSGAGTVFAINTDGTGFTNLYSFTNGSDGAYPSAGLILSSNTLYGTTSGEGARSQSSGSGTVFAINTDGTGFTNLYNFTALSGSSHINSDGAYPLGTLILSGNTLYGTAPRGGTNGFGTVFAVNTDGTGFTNLYSFTGYSDGGFPFAGLILSSNTLYGTTCFSGSLAGTVFAINTDGTGFTNLYSFTNTSNGAFPAAPLLLSGNTLFGTTESGGSSGVGTVFAIDTDGTDFETLYSFTNGSDGAYPIAGLILSGNTLYGTESGIGNLGGSGLVSGAVFSLSLPVLQLTIILSGPNVILTWPTNVAGFNYSGFSLQSTTNLASPVVWSPVSVTPVIINGQNTMTNPVSGTQQFYRLINDDSATTVADPTLTIAVDPSNAHYYLVTPSCLTAGADIYRTSIGKNVNPLKLPWRGGIGFNRRIAVPIRPYSEMFWIQARKTKLTSSNLIKIILPASS
jgi:uncharacterized repeat protein (TIGR03803 family)